MRPDPYSAAFSRVRDRPEWEPLAVTIAEARGGQGAGEVAFHVLNEEEGSRTLDGVQVEEDDVQAVYYEIAWKKLVGMPVGPGGRDGKGRLVKFSGVHGFWQVEDWLRDGGAAELDWVHPRWRWALNQDKRSSSRIYD